MGPRKRESQRSCLAIVTRSSSASQKAVGIKITISAPAKEPEQKTSSKKTSSRIISQFKKLSLKGSSDRVTPIEVDKYVTSFFRNGEMPQTQMRATVKPKIYHSPNTEPRALIPIKAERSGGASYSTAWDSGFQDQGSSASMANTVEHDGAAGPSDQTDLSWGSSAHIDYSSTPYDYGMVYDPIEMSSEQARMALAEEGTPPPDLAQPLSPLGKGKQVTPAEWRDGEGDTLEQSNPNFGQTASFSVADRTNFVQGTQIESNTTGPYAGQVNTDLAAAGYFPAVSQLYPASIVADEHRRGGPSTTSNQGWLTGDQTHSTASSSRRKRKDGRKRH